MHAYLLVAHAISVRFALNSALQIDRAHQWIVALRIQIAFGLTRKLAHCRFNRRRIAFVHYGFYTTLVRRAVRRFMTLGVAQAKTADQPVAAVAVERANVIVVGHSRLVRTAAKDQCHAEA